MVKAAGKLFAVFNKTDELLFVTEYAGDIFPGAGKYQTVQVVKAAAKGTGYEDKRCLFHFGQCQLCVGQILSHGKFLNGNAKTFASVPGVRGGTVTIAENIIGNDIVFPAAVKAVVSGENF